MSWLEDLRYMESNVEDEDENEKNLEKENIGIARPKELNSKNDLKDEIESVNNSIDVIIDFKSLGFDITEAVSEATNKLKNLIEFGKNEGLLNNDELSSLNGKLQFLLSLIGRKENMENRNITDDNNYER